MNTSAIGNVAALIGAPVQASAAPPANAQQRALIQAVKTVNSAGLMGQDNELTFIMDRHTRGAVVRIVDKSTGKVLQQIPSESVLRIAEEYQTGSGEASASSA